MQSLLTSAVYSWLSTKSLEHKQETCVISSSVQYIACHVGYLTSRKEDNNISGSVSPHYFTYKLNFIG